MPQNTESLRHNHLLGRKRGVPVAQEEMMKRTFELGIGCISSPITLLRNRADFLAWRRKRHADYSADDAPFYPCFAYTVLRRDECDYAEFLSELEAYNIAAKMREAAAAIEAAQLTSIAAQQSVASDAETAPRR